MMDIDDGLEMQKSEQPLRVLALRFIGFDLSDPQLISRW